MKTGVYIKKAAGAARGLFLTLAAVSVLAAPGAARADQNASFHASLPTDFVWEDYETKSEEWWLSDEAGALAGEIVACQTEDGGWRKSMKEAMEGPWVNATLDNGATWGQIRFLAKYFKETGRESARAACERGVEFLLNTQHPCGGWAQIPAAENNYQAHITFNDGATTEALKVLKMVSERSEAEGFSWVDGELAGRAGEALARGLDWIVKSQVRVGGRLTGWCQQYDENTLLPAQGRAYEPAAVSTWESAVIIEFVLSVGSGDPLILESVRAAAAWLEEAKITGARFERVGDDRVLVPGGADDVLWARYYDLKNLKPVFGDRDGKVYQSVQEISQERRNGYDWYGTWPASALEAARAAGL